MKVANIFPIKNQKHYKKEDFGMVLAHLVKEDLYKAENVNHVGYMIMDNGLFEKAQVSTNLQDLIDLAEKSGLNIHEIVVPDIVNETEANIRLFEQNIPTIKKWQHKYRFMFVAQAATYKDLAKAVAYINGYRDELNLSIGISKLSPLDRGSIEAIEIYKKAEFPIHLLGIKTTFKELLPVYRYVRSCDTSQIPFIAKNVEDIAGVDIVNYVREGIDIDLAEDKCDDKILKKLLERERKALTVYGIL